MLPATYLSNDALERADAYRYGYRTVCQHPKEIGLLEPNETLVIDFNTVLFDDQEMVIVKANEAARRGVLVGIHTYHPQALEVYRLAKLPNVLVAKNHRQLLVKLGRYAKLHGRPWLHIAKAAKSHESEVNDVHEHAETEPVVRTVGDHAHA